MIKYQRSRVKYLRNNDGLSRCDCVFTFAQIYAAPASPQPIIPLLNRFGADTLDKQRLIFTFTKLTLFNPSLYSPSIERVVYFDADILIRQTEGLYSLIKSPHLTVFGRNGYNFNSGSEGIGASFWR